MSGEPRGRRQTAARTAGQPPGEAGRRGLLWGAHLIGVGDVPGVGQHEGAELVEILHGSLALLRGLQGTAPQGQTVPAHPVPAPADGRTDRRTDGPTGSPSGRPTPSPPCDTRSPVPSPPTAGHAQQRRNRESVPGEPRDPGDGRGRKVWGTALREKGPHPLTARGGERRGGNGSGDGTHRTPSPPHRPGPAGPRRHLIAPKMAPALPGCPRPPPSPPPPRGAPLPPHRGRAHSSAARPRVGGGRWVVELFPPPGAPQPTAPHPSTAPPRS